MTSTSGAMGSRSGRSRDISPNSGKGMYSSSGSGAGMGSTSGRSSYSGEAGGGCKNSERSAGAGAGGTSATLSRRPKYSSLYSLVVVVTTTVSHALS